ncbi:PAQR family membrane homeostasis protein TrhA [Frateuria aurantia]|uniref:Channel protein, hemolysin III family n=1 Tax=Frateuria aurantia (strain ATCC 33424 / DSM 6220 / KCTC 2777 / LMG 1558 / NBRC 3245 / NCIMB 13370) TaxID=767434 RepID=H8KYW6_FRAAD|nr:hemolysin III family protein [Frateuria aurantia]AFC86996.1 channel protein, hemolysin III family [Frateuria aurantia DSM 6220]
MSVTIRRLPRHQVWLDEVGSSVTHGIGIVLSVIGLTVLVAVAAVHGSTRSVVACSIYGASLVLLYSASTLYHSIPYPLARRILRTIDHVAIFLLIAGTYTPFTLLALPGPWGWTLFGLVWGLALIGSLAQLGLFKSLRRLELVLYIIMGWICIVAIEPLYHHLSRGGLAMLVAGGVAYTLGVPFYLARRMPWHHTIWHFFVLAGSVLHFLAILLYVVPASTD